jgi:hypothetical protein
MSDQAKVTSLEAIESFRAKLIVFRTKAGGVLDEVGDEVTRTRLWLENERPTYWKNEIRRRQRVLEQRQQEFFGAHRGGLREGSQQQRAAVEKARRAIQDAEERLQAVRQWYRQFDQRVEPLGRNVEKFRHAVQHDVSNATVWLGEMIKTLAAYAELSSSSGPAPSPAPTEIAGTKSAEPEGGIP